MQSDKVLDQNNLWNNIQAERQKTTAVRIVKVNSQTLASWIDDNITILVLSN